MGKINDGTLGDPHFALTAETTDPSLQLTSKIYATFGSIHEHEQKIDSIETLPLKITLQVNATV